jgi:hypothetical protein
MPRYPNTSSASQSRLYRRTGGSLARTAIISGPPVYRIAIRIPNTATRSHYLIAPAGIFRLSPIERMSFARKTRLSPIEMHRFEVDIADLHQPPSGNPPSLLIYLNTTYRITTSIHMWICRSLMGMSVLAGFALPICTVFCSRAVAQELHNMSAYDRHLFTKNACFVYNK